MKLTFRGAVGTVTGSMHQIETNGRQILLDCGLFQGKRQEARERNEHFPFDPAKIDAVVLSHAHMDHSGNLPTLVKQGFGQSIYATSATRDLCSAMLRDSASIQESDAVFVNKINAGKGLPLIEPMYSQQDAVDALRLFHTVEYDRPTQILPGVQLTFRDAGHILGSASVTLEISENGSKPVRLAFTGDVGRKGAAILRDPEILDHVDSLITEATYGSREHGPMEQASEKLGQVVRETVSRGGVLIIPAFAVGRTQDIVYNLHQLSEAGSIPSIPVFVDSPLAVNVTEIFRLHPECYDQETHQHMLEDQHPDPFGFSRLTYVRSADESKKLNSLDRPAIIISASGMCEAGRVLHHLRHHIEDPRTTVLFVGYQAPYTLGRRLVDGEKRVRIYGEEHQVKAHIETIDGYSAHADQSELLDYIDAIPGRPDQVFVVHAEPESAESLADALRKQGAPKVIIPEPGQSFEL